MPADREEIDACIEERIAIDELLSPLELLTENSSIKGLRCARMKLGEIDESGRRRPLPIEGEELLIEADTIIAAIGEEVEIRSLEKNRIKLNDGRTVLVNPETGETSLPGVYAAGDCVRGPATVVEAIADAKTVARSIMKAEGLPHETLDDRMYEAPSAQRIAENMPRRAAVSFFEPVKTLPLDRRKGFDTVIQTLNGKDAARESERCLRCSELCSKCVEVCPNRANLTLFMDPADLDACERHAVSQATQILHVDDFCNECGNCETFCVHEGKPYMVKPTLFSSEEPFSSSENSGFYYKNRGEHGHCFVCRLDGHVYDMYIDGDEVRFSRDADIEGMVGLSLVARNLLSHHAYLLT
jgi:putative selenate reductase